MAEDIYAFLDLEGIEGEAQDSDYEKKIELQSFSWGASNNNSFSHGTGGSVSKGQIHDISFTKLADKASVRLMDRVVSGLHIKKAKVSLLKQSGEKKIPYLEIELTDVIVTSWQLSGSGGGHLPMESGSLGFAKMHTYYKPQGNEGDAAGNVEFGWDLQKNAAA
jgi:type VI secretion system secreted protein Hcp